MYLSFMHRLGAKNTIVGRFVTLMFACFVSNNLSAQIVKINELVDKAISDYPQLQQRRSEINFGKAHEKTVGAYSLPALIVQNQLNMGTDNSLAGAYFPLGLIPSASGGNANSSKGLLNAGDIAVSYLHWDIFNFGYYEALKKEALSQTEVLNANFEYDKYLITQDVILLYIDWLKKFELLKTKRQEVYRAEVILNAIRSLVGSGLRPGVDSSTARASYSAARISAIQATDDFKKVALELGKYSGYNLLGSIPDTNLTTLNIIENLKTILPFDSIPAEHPIINLFEKQVETQQLANKTNEKRYLPKLGLEGAYWVRSTGISPNGTFTDNLQDHSVLSMPYSAFNYLFGVTATYNLTDIRHRNDQIREGNYLLESKKYALNTQLQNLNTLVMEANTSFQLTLEKLTELPVMQRSALRAYQQQLALYKSGLNTLTDVTNAELALLEAESSFIIARTELLQLMYLRIALSGQTTKFLQQLK